jgi:filamentous hemagglutinin family protein
MGMIPKGFVLKAAGVAVGFALAGLAGANPNGPAVVRGQATFQASGKTLTITNAPGTIINWQGFSIAADELTRFLQQSPVSSVLNRVVGANPSEILGRLQSNGQVFLINQNGIVFGRGSQVDVAGFTASTLNISDADFISGRKVFSGTGAEGRIVNQGEIRAAAGGSVYLVAPQVENSGIIRAPSGEIVLAAGRTVRLMDSRFPSIQVEVTAGDGKDLSLGDLSKLEAGRVLAFAVKQSGVVSASAAGTGDGGKVVLKSAGEVQLAAGSRTEATGIAAGGTVAVEAPRVTIAFGGTIDVSGASAGGRVDVIADKVVFAGTIDARAGASGDGGEVAVSGGTELIFAGTIDVSGGTSGGRVDVVADKVLFAGRIDARAHVSGDGGAVEVSGRTALVFAGTVDTRAASGKDGALLIDPSRITVVAGTTGMPAALADGTWVAGEDVGAQTIGAADLTNLLKTTSVTLQASEHVMVAAGAVIEASAPGRTLTLQAPQVVFQGTLRTSAAPVNLNIQAASARVEQAATLDLGGGKLEVAARTVSVEPAVEAQRPRAQETMARASTTVPPEVQKLRAEVVAEIERDNARIAAAMSQSCSRAGAPKQGCTVAVPAKRFAFSG